METYYSILELHPSSTNAEITDSYSRLSKFQHRIDNNDYDNFHEQIRINNVNQAYNILRDRCKIFQYDIRNFGKIEYVDLNFNNESDLQNFISTILDE